MTKPLIGRIGIIAGGGSLPGEIARSVISRGGEVFLVLIHGEADEALKAFAHTEAGWAQLGRARAALKQAGMVDLLLVGRMARPDWRKARPDWGFLSSLPQVIRTLTAGGDDAVLRGALSLFEPKGFRVRGVGEVAPELLIGEGRLTLAMPDADDERDMALGFAAIAALGAYDIGQAAIVRGGQIKAIEAAEGTDRMLERVRDSRAEGCRSGVLVKRPKPSQDMRIDLPAVGPATVDRAAAAGLRGIAVMAGEVLIADRMEFVRRANAEHLFAIGVGAAAAGHGTRHENASAVDEPLIFGRTKPAPSSRRDIELGSRIHAEVARLPSEPAIIVIVNGRVIAVGIGEDPTAVVGRAGQWLRRRSSKRRRGVLLLGPGCTIEVADVGAASNAGLDTIISVLQPDARTSITDAVIDAGDRFAIAVGATEIADARRDLS